jgi:cytochrome o ubiquinol oxidase subunit IV
MKPAHVVDVPHGTTRIYLIGFILSIILTAIPFTLVMTGSLPVVALIPTIVVIAAGQIVVHLVCFLHLNRSSEQGWNLTAFSYTVIVLVILVGASVWIMYHLNYNMMVGLQ